MLVFLSIVFIIVPLLLLSLRIKVNVSADILNNRGDVLVRLFGITVFKKSFRIVCEDCLMIKYGKNKREKEIHLNTDKTDKRSILTIVSNSVFKNLIFKFINFNSVIGFKDEPVLTVTTVTGLKIALNAVNTIASKKFFVVIKGNVVPSFLEHQLKFDITAKVEMPIYSLIINIIKLIVKTTKSLREMESSVKTKQSRLQRITDK